MRRPLPLLIALSLLVSLGTATAQARSLPVKAAMLADITHERVLFSQDPDEAIAPASLTKVLTLYVIFDAINAGRINPRSTVRVSAKAAETGGSTMHLKARERVSWEELIRGIAVASGNDACVAAAEQFKGGVEGFVRLMNRKARDLGMTNSVFKNPNGLPAKGQVTTARDMLTLATSYLKHYPNSLQIHSVKNITHNGLSSRNCNRLLGTCDGVDGLKTGFVASSGFNNIVTAERDGTRLVAVVLGARKASIRTTQTRNLLELGFAKVGTSPGASSRGLNTAKVERPAAPATSRPVEEVEVAEAAEEIEETGGDVLAVADEYARDRVAIAAMNDPGSAGAPRLAVTDEVERLASRIRRTTATSPTSGTTSAISMDTSAKRALDRGYAIQISSWRSEPLARNRARELQRQGLEAWVTSVNLGDKGVWHRVMIGSFPTLDTARQYRRVLASQYRLTDTIILGPES